MSILLTRRAVVQAAMESTYGVTATVGANDGVLVASPEFTVDATVLERDFTRDSLSRTPHIMGRKLAKMTFKTELRGNGKQQSGNAADAAIVTRLFRMCGYALTAQAASSAHGVFDIGDHAHPVTWTVDASAADNTDVHCYFVEVTTGGASGTAQVTVTSDTVGEGSLAEMITTGTDLEVGTHGLTITPAFTGSLVVGQKWVLWLLPPGLALDPISDDFESGTLVMNKDGVLHTMPGCFGSFQIDATAGQYASITWTFTGIWNPPIDAPLTNPHYERTLPSMVELARLRVEGFYAVVEKFTYDQGNDIQVRPDVSSSQGYIGTRIVSRDPKGGIDPEADLVANNDFWSQMAEADRMPFQMRVGHQPGNTVWILAPGVQYSGLTYQDRNGILTYDAGMKFPAYDTNDEARFFFC
jgi:hypothetical protein